RGRRGDTHHHAVRRRRPLLPRGSRMAFRHRAGYPQRHNGETQNSQSPNGPPRTASAEGEKKTGESRHAAFLGVKQVSSNQFPAGFVQATDSEQSSPAKLACRDKKIIAGSSDSSDWRRGSGEGSPITGAASYVAECTTTLRSRSSSAELGTRFRQ